MSWHELKAEIAKHLDVPEQEIEEPDKEKMGDFAWPAFSKAKVEKKNPVEVAKALAAKLKVKGIKEIKPVGPYVNFFVDWAALGNEILKEAGPGYGKGNEKRKAVIDLSSPNPAHPFHMGTVRSTVIGEAVARTLEGRGWKVDRLCYVNDLGKQAATLLTGYLRYANGQKPEGKPDVWLGKLYMKINEESEQIEDEVFQNLHKYELGDRTMRELGRKVFGWCLEGFGQNWKLLGVKFDHMFWESDLVGESKLIIKELEKKKLTFESEGAMVLNLEPHGLPNTIIQRKDGSGLYLSRDIPQAIWRWKSMKPDLNLYVVAEGQSTHFNQLFKTLELLGHGELAKRSRHLAYGTVLLEGEKMSSRKGITVLWDQLLEEGIKRAKEEIIGRWPDLSEKERNERAEQIAVGAIIYYILKYSPEKTVNFTWSEAMRFEGDTGPYLQYTHARARSILAKEKAKSFDAKHLTDEKEKAVLRMLAQWPSVLKKSATDLQPHQVAEYLHKLADSFNEFYQTIRVIQAENDKLKGARLKLVEAVSEVLKTAMTLLAVPSPDKM